MTKNPSLYDNYYGGFLNNKRHGFGIQHRIQGTGGMNSSQPWDYSEDWEAYKDGELIWKHRFSEYADER